MAGRRVPTRAILELFVFANLAFLALDVYVAHSYNQFAHWAEWIPFGLSVIAPPLLVVAWILAGLTEDRPGLGRALGLGIALACLLVGLAGMIFHLESQFFEELTLENLVYTAPFVAPLAYAGLGLLLLLDRTVEAGTVDWARWVLLLALGGFAGNFALSLADHAQNGFFRAEEWIAVIASGFAVGFLGTLVIAPANALLRRVTVWVMLIQIPVGLLGFAYHLQANVHGPMEALWEDFLYGAPVFAPLLFPNLALLALFGLWALGRPERPRAVERAGATARATTG